jgi:hypothetical protein
MGRYGVERLFRSSQGTLSIEWLILFILFNRTAGPNTSQVSYHIY